MDRVAELRSCIGASQDAPLDHDWGHIETSVGLSFPESYKELCRYYRGLEFDEFLLVRNIAESVREGDESDSVRHALDYLSAVTDGESSVTEASSADSMVERPVFPYYPEPGGLYPWGSTSNGDICLWRTEGPPAGWSIVVTDGGLWFEFDMGIIEFLLQVVKSEVRAFPALDCSGRRVRESLCGMTRESSSHALSSEREVVARR